MLQVKLTELQNIAEDYTDAHDWLGDKYPMSIIHRTFRDGRHSSSEYIPTFFAEMTMQGLAAGNEPFVASARIVAVEFVAK